MSTPSPSPLQLLFLGTGTSTGLPLAPCLTDAHPYPKVWSDLVPLNLPSSSHPASPGQYDPAGPWPRNVKCACCRATADRDIPEGWKNKRGNTSVVLRKKRAGKWRNVVVDVGKTFREQAVRFFPRWGVHTIDAVIFTHGHADAYFGLDDLREWCIRQGAIIPVYLDQPTYDTVAKSFPYLVDKTQASGGGDIPSLEWHIIDHEEEFEVEGINVKALPVEHGVYFRVPPGTSPSQKLKPEPLICLGFMFDDSIVYMSDVSQIPPRTWDRLLQRTVPDSSARANGKSRASISAIPGLRGRLNNGAIVIPPTPQDTPGSTRPASPSGPLSKLAPGAASSASASVSAISSHASAILPSSHPPLPILIIDALWPIRRHASHTNFPQALDIAIRLNAQSTYFVGFTHPATHYMWDQICRSIRGEGVQEHPEKRHAERLIEKVWSDGQFGGDKGRAYREWAGQVAPAWDGLCLQVHGERFGEVVEDSVGGWGV